ncbi:MAG: hypothetical protein KU37_04040 [Sulfuricurvum sp. PC08-66]|nr:MAG: hypothetical protein KU37_04040 [Sulfuricurvum sp. PC08-66]
MMPKSIRIVAWTLLGLFLVGAFIDKERVWYTIEAALAPYEVVIEGQEVSGLGWGMHVENAQLYLYGMHTSTIESLSIRPWILHNSVTLSHLTIPEDLKMVEGLGIDEAHITHIVWNPTVAHIDAVGSFGSLQGVIDLKERTVNLSIDPSKLMLQNRTIMPFIKRTKEGYSYDGRF